jgi:hypothetical protein
MVDKLRGAFVQHAAPRNFGLDHGAERAVDTFSGTGILNRTQVAALGCLFGVIEWLQN